MVEATPSAGSVPKLVSMKPAGPPPRRGRGSGRDAWAAWAEACEVDVPSDASRDDIIALVERATSAQEPTPPPRNGPGATAEAWRAYARDLGYTVPAGATRTAVIAMIEAGPAQPAETRSPLAASLEVTLAELRRMRRLEKVDEARIELLRGLVAAIETDLSNAALWRQYREALDEVLKVDEPIDDDLDRALQRLQTLGPGSHPPMGHPEAS